MAWWLLSTALLVAPPLVLGVAPSARLAIDSDSLLVVDTALDVASMQSGSVLQRIAALRSGTHGLDLTGLNVQAGERRIGGDSLNAVSKPILGPVFDGVLNSGGVDRWGVFANGDVRRSGGATVDDSIGMTTGIDYRLGDHLAVGSSVGYASFGVEAPQQTLLDVQSRGVSLFGTYYQQDLMHVDGLITYGNNAYDSVRRVNGGDVQGLAPANARGTMSGSQISGALTSALDLRNGPWRFGPKVGAYFLDIDVDPLNEYGAGDRDLVVDAQIAQSLRLSAGAHVSLALRVPFGVLTPSFNADYVHDDDRSAAADVRSTTRLVGSPDAALSQMEPGYFVWSVGASAQLAEALSGFVNYRTLASIDSAASTEWTWGVRFETKLR